MKSITNLIQKISYEEALKKVNGERVFSHIKSNKDELLPKTLKVMVLAIVAWLFSLFGIASWGFFPFFAGVIVLAVFIWYSVQPKYFKDAAYNLAMFLLAQTGLIFYIVSIQFFDNLIFDRIMMSVYVIVTYLVSFYFLKSKIQSNIQEKYLDYQPQDLKLSIKIIKKVTYLLGALVVLFFVLLELYRLTKSWFILSDFNFNFLAGVHNPIIDDLIVVFFFLLIMLIFVLVSLLPTLLIDEDKITEGLVLKKYAEEFRVRYQLSKKDWYGE